MQSIEENGDWLCVSVAIMYLERKKNGCANVDCDKEYYNIVICVLCVIFGLFEIYSFTLSNPLVSN